MYEQYLHASSIDRLANDALMLPVAQRRLGELYEARGDRARAALHYAAFIDLWKGADPDLQPQVADVRQRVARLGVAKKS
jgi:hypothetical protein